MEDLFKYSKTIETKFKVLISEFDLKMSEAVGDSPRINTIYNSGGCNGHICKFNHGEIFGAGPDVWL